jgi:hypothetical protein
VLRLAFSHRPAAEWEQLFPLRGRWLRRLGVALGIAWVMSWVLYPALRLLP